MRFDSTTLLADPLLRRSVENENRLAEECARMAANLKRENDAARFKPADAGRLKPLASGENPFTDAGWNLTQQALVLKNDPDMAKRLKAEAGLAGLETPTREDARRAVQSGLYVELRRAAAEKAANPQQASQAAPEPIQADTRSAMVALAVRAAATARIHVPADRLDAIADELGKVAQIGADGTVSLRDEKGRPMLDWAATAATARCLDLTPETYLLELHRDRPELFEASETAKPEKPAPATSNKPLHQRVAEATAAGPEAVAALKSELGGRA